MGQVWDLEVLSLAQANREKLLVSPLPKDIKGWVQPVRICYKFQCLVENWAAEPGEYNSCVCNVY